MLQGALGTSLSPDPFVTAGDCNWRTTGAMDCASTVTVGSYVCRQDVDDGATSAIEFTTASVLRYSNSHRLNCTTIAPATFGVDPTSPAPEVRTARLRACRVQGRQEASCAGSGHQHVARRRVVWCLYGPLPRDDPTRSQPAPATSLAGC